MHILSQLSFLSTVTSSLSSLQPFILPRLIKWVPGIPVDLAVESKLYLSSGSVGLRQLNPFHKKGSYFFILSLFLYHIIVIFIIPCFSGHELLFTKSTDLAKFNFFRIKVYIQQLELMFYHFIHFNHTTIFRITAQETKVSNIVVQYLIHVLLRRK